MRHPIGDAENKAIGAVLYPPRPRRRIKRGHHGGLVIGSIIIGLILLAVAPWWLPALIILAAIVIPVMAGRQ